MFALPLLLLLVAPADLVYTARPAPGGTTIRASFATEQAKGPEALLDGDETTFMSGAPNSAGVPASLFLRFPAPLEDLAGVATGRSDPFHNYYPEEFHFYVDTTGDGDYDTYVGRTLKLGPAEQCVGDHLFERKPARAHGLEIRVVKMSQKGLRRAFMLNDLRLLHSPAVWGGELTEPTRPGALKPLNLPADLPTPLTLLDPADRPGVTVIRGGENKQQATWVGEPARLGLVWQGPGAKGFFELVFRQPPLLYAFGAGVVLTVPVNADGLPGVSGPGIRVRDAYGETFQWGGSLAPGRTGWQDARIVLDPARHGGHWGGPAERAGVVDEPVRLLAITFTAPDELAGRGEVLVGPIARNAFDPAQIEPGVLYRQVEARLTGPRRALVVTWQEVAAGGEPIKLTLRNKAEYPVEGRVVGTVQPFNGPVSGELPGALFKLTPGQESQVPFELPVRRPGWYELKLSLRVEPRQSEQPVERTELGAWSIAVIDPAGQRPPLPDDFQFSVGGSLHDDDTAEIARLIGVDWTREGGSWSDLEREPGKYDWSRLDQIMARADKFGLTVQLLTGFAPRWAAKEGYLEKYRPEGWQVNTLAPRPELWRGFMRALGERYKGRIRLWEIHNEPDLEGFFKGTTDDYLEGLRIAAEELRAIDPANKVMTGGFATVGAHGGHALNPDLQERVLRDGQDYFDIHTHHEHGGFKHFQQAVDGELARLRALPRQPKPLYLNETAESAGGGLVNQAAALVKKITFAKARGAAAYSWFLMYGRNPGLDTWGMLAYQTYQPRPTVCAFNELIKLLRGTTFVDQAPLGPDDWGFRFTSRETGLLVAWTEAAGEAREPLLVRLPAGRAEQLDLMGQRSPVTVTDGVAALSLTGVPVYLQTSGAPAEVVGKLVRVGGEVLGEPGSRLEVPARVSNPLTRPAELTCRWTDGDGREASRALALAAGESRDVSLPVILPAAPGRAAGMTVEYALAGTPWTGRVTLPLRLSRRLAAGPIGDRPADFTLDGGDAIRNFNQHDPTREHLVWRGPDDLSAKVWLGLADGALQLRLDVRDDRHVQPRRGAQVWQADGVQVAFQIPGQPGWWEFGLTRLDDGADEVYTFTRPTGAADPTAAIALRTTLLPGGLRYEAAFPLASLGLTAESAATGFAFSLIVNDDDGGGREGWAQISEGIGTTKDPSRFPVVQLR